MAERNVIDVEYLRKALAYDAEAGTLTWVHRDDVPNQWNTAWAGRPAFTALHNGYPMGRVNYKKYAAHRVAWALLYGYWPEEVDHINGDRSDYRASNLREVTRSENAKNVAKPKNNTSGHVGVSWCKVCGKWLASIRVARKRINLGRFSSIDDAIAARAAANELYGFHKNHGR